MTDIAESDAPEGHGFIENAGWTSVCACGDLTVRSRSDYQRHVSAYVTCRHCGDLGPVGSDHTCPCPHTDHDCADHPEPTACDVHVPGRNPESRICPVDPYGRPCAGGGHYCCVIPPAMTEVTP